MPSSHKIPDAQIHEFVAGHIKKGTTMHWNHWFVAKDLKNWVDLIRRRKIGGTAYLGCGDWYTYLERNHQLKLEKPAKKKRDNTLGQLLKNARKKPFGQRDKPE